MTQPAKPAAFLDRDGTIIRDANYIRDPNDVEVLTGAAAAIRRLNEAGVPVIVITNQSGITRGYLTPRDYEGVHQRLVSLLAADGARLDATYYCPHYPPISGECDCRKPGLLLYQTAITEHNLDPQRSLFVGDRWRDVAPALSLGGHPILLDVGSTPPDDKARSLDAGIPTAGSLEEAVNSFLSALPSRKLPR